MALELELGLAGRRMRSQMWAVQGSQLVLGLKPQQRTKKRTHQQPCQPARQVDLQRKKGDRVTSA